MIVKRLNCSVFFFSFHAILWTSPFIFGYQRHFDIFPFYVHRVWNVTLWVFGFQLSSSPSKIAVGFMPKDRMTEHLSWRHSHSPNNCVFDSKQGRPGAPGLKGDGGESGPQVRGLHIFLCVLETCFYLSYQLDLSIKSCFILCFPPEHLKINQLKHLYLLSRDLEVFRVQLAHQEKQEKG